MCANVCIEEALAHELNPNRARTKTNKRACWTVHLICRKGPQNCCGRKCNSCNLSQYQKEMSLLYCDVTSVLFCYLGLPITIYYISFENLRRAQSSGAAWKSRWPSWAFRPNEPYGFCGRKAILNHASALVTVCPWYVNPTSEDMKLYVIIIRRAQSKSTRSRKPAWSPNGWVTFTCNRLCARPELSQCRLCKSPSD